MKVNVNDIGGKIVKQDERYIVKDNTDLNNLVVSSTRLQPRKATSGHSHAGQEEVYYFIEGTGKMELGEDVGCKYPNSELGKNHNKLTILNPIDASKIFFKYLKVQIERYVKNNSLPSNIQYAISIPASFEANQRRDLVDSLESNGFMINKQ